MRLAFFAQYGMFELDRLGGVESIVRRLSAELLKRDVVLECLFFDAPNDHVMQHLSGVVVRNQPGFLAGLKALSRYDHVLLFYLPARLRPLFSLFRATAGRRVTFHYIYSVWAESFLKRQLLFSEALLAPYNGYLFGVSPRLCRRLSRLSARSALLLPPVPADFFLTPEQKSQSGPLRVAFMGRIDPGKGIGVAISLFESLAGNAQYSCSIYGYPWKHDSASMQLHNALLQRRDINYQPSELKRFDQTVMEHVRQIFLNTDVLFLPYERLSSTIDTPLVMLEGMAGLCAVITRPLGDLPEIYGSHRYMQHDLSDIRGLRNMVDRLRMELPAERKRLAQQVQRLDFSSDRVATRLLEKLNQRNPNPR